MDLAFLTSFFGWMTLFNIGILALTSGTLLFARNWVADIHSRMFGLAAADLDRIYFAYLANFKIAVIVLNLVPYLALRVMA